MPIDPHPSDPRREPTDAPRLGIVPGSIAPGPPTRADADNARAKDGWNDAPRHRFPRLGAMLSALRPPRTPKAEIPTTELLLRAGSATYALSPAQAHGYYGLFRVGIDAAQGCGLGVKQLHHHPEHLADGLPVPGNAQVHSQRRSVIVNELEVQSRVGALKPVAVVEVDAQIFVLMKLMQGDLAELVQALHADARLPVSWSILAQSATNLAACHRAGFVHRDIKSENILWDLRGGVVVADYGLAVARDDTAALQQKRGTVFSLPPEAFSSLPCNEKLDVWLLAVTMLHVLTPEHRPFMTGYRDDPTLTQAQQWEAQIEFARARVAAFVEVREAWLRGEAIADLRWAVPLAQARYANPGAFDFVMRHMLDPNPASRYSMAMVAAFAMAHFHGMPEAAKRLCLNAFARPGHASHQQHRAILAGLHA